MKTAMEFEAPWCLSLKITSFISIFVLLAIVFVGITNASNYGGTWLIGMVLLPLSILLSGSLHIIRGYTLTDDTLLVQRLGWATEIPLAGLRSVEIDPEAMLNSVRTIGNGGFLCYAGKFRSRKLGSYRAYATDYNRSVTLRFHDSIIVVTPGEPDKFAKQLRNRIGSVNS